MNFLKQQIDLEVKKYRLIVLCRIGILGKKVYGGKKYLIKEDIPIWQRQ